MRFFRLFLLLLLTCTLSITAARSQVNRNQLTGLWHTPNTDSLYDKADSIKFYLYARKWVDTGLCPTVTWDIEKRTFRLSQKHQCSEPGWTTTVIGKERLLLRKRDFGQVIQLKRDRKIIDHFKLLELSESIIKNSTEPIKQLELLRFDKLEDHKLYRHVDSLVYQVLKYSPKLAGSPGQKISGKDSISVNMRIRDKSDLNPMPLLVVNGIPTEDYDLLKAFRLVETIDIHYLTKEQATCLYGYRAMNGVIIVTVSPKKFKKHCR